MSDRYTAYCGLYCDHCYSRTHIAPTAAKLKEQMRAQGFESFGPYMPDYEAFWRFLSTLIDAEGCPGAGMTTSAAKRGWLSRRPLFGY